MAEVDVTDAHAGLFAPSRRAASVGAIALISMLAFEPSGFFASKSSAMTTFRNLPGTGTPRLVDVTVTSPDGSEATLPRAFRYYYGTLELTQGASARVAAGAQSLDVGDA